LRSRVAAGIPRRQWGVRGGRGRERRRGGLGRRTRLKVWGIHNGPKKKKKEVIEDLIYEKYCAKLHVTQKILMLNKFIIQQSVFIELFIG
jgi:hypothetical protein